MGGNIVIPWPIEKIPAKTAGSRPLGLRTLDVATLGNLCVDIVLNVPKLLPKPHDQRKAYMDELSKTPPDKAGPKEKGPNGDELYNCGFGD